MIERVSVMSFSGQKIVEAHYLLFARKVRSYI
jgi:hypothetical protein